MSKMIYQNENAVLNHLGVRKLVKGTATMKVDFAIYGTPAEIKQDIEDMKKAGATNIKLK